MEGLNIYRCPNPKIRLGCQNVGGDVIADLSGGYDMFITVGTMAEISFEKDFLDRYDVKHAHALDVRIDALPTIPGEESRLKFQRCTPDELPERVKTLVKKARRAFLKIDIQGFEYLILPAIAPLMANVKQLLIQVHTPAEITSKPEFFKSFQSITTDNFLTFMKKIAETHTMIHMNHNNGTGVHYVKDCPIPNVFAATWVCGGIEDRKRTLAAVPSPLDQPCYPGRAVFIFSGEPWTA